MRLASRLILIAPVFALLGCASQQTLDAQADAVGRRIDALNQAQASIATTHKDLEARIARLESEQALVAARLSQGDPATAALQRDIDSLRDQTAATRDALAELAGKTQASIAMAQKDLEARLARLESEQALAAARLSQDDQATAALQREIDSLRSQTAATRDALAELAGTAQSQAGAIAQAQSTADDAVKIARDSRLVSGKVIDKLVLTEEMVLYNYEAPELTPAGRAVLDTLIARTRPQLPHVFIEIIGFSDNLSLGSQNSRIALDRAESVRRYLHETGNIPLHRMSVISYGDLKPVTNDPAFESRRQNRRVIVQVLK